MAPRWRRRCGGTMQSDVRRWRRTAVIFSRRSGMHFVLLFRGPKLLSRPRFNFRAHLRRKISRPSAGYAFGRRYIRARQTNVTAIILGRRSSRRTAARDRARWPDAAFGVMHDLVLGKLPPQTSLRDLGEHRLKDLSRPEYVYQLVAPVANSTLKVAEWPCGVRHEKRARVTLWNRGRFHSLSNGSNGR